MASSFNVETIIWDYDGTLVDTRRKNLNVTRKIIRMITGVSSQKFRALRSLESYALANQRSANWRDFYEREFGFTDGQTDEAGRAWTEYQLRDSTPIPVFDGIHEVLRTLGSVRHGIVSQNSRSAIEQILKEHSLLQYFGFIVGYEEVELRRQKPEPDGLLLCIENLHGPNATPVLYIGDHETDARCASNANHVLQKANSATRVLSIGALYSPNADSLHWKTKPDYEARSVHDIVKIALAFL